MDPRAPWSGDGGCGRRSGRSRAVGPTRGAVASRVAVVDLKPARGFAVDSGGSILVADARASGLLRVRPDGSLEAVGKLVGVGTPLLLASGPLVVAPDAQAFTAFGHETYAEVLVRSPWAAGLGHVVSARKAQGIDAHASRSPGELRWRAPIPRAAAGIALAPGAVVVVLTEGGLGARGSLHRFELATGKALTPLSLERVGTSAGAVVVGEDGAVYLGLGGSVGAVAPGGGRLLFRYACPGAPMALAGEGADVVVVADPLKLPPLGLDARSGKRLWELRDTCFNGSPKVDARGVVYWRREAELVALDPRTGKIAQVWLVGDRYWDFAFTTGERVVCLRQASASIAELVVLE